MANRIAQTEPSVKGKETNFDFKQLPSWSSDQETGDRSKDSVDYFIYSPHHPITPTSKKLALHHLFKGGKGF
jgi:hypothetical protein